MMKTTSIATLALFLAIGCKSDKKETPEEAAKTAGAQVPAEPEAKPRTAKESADIVERYGKAYAEADEVAIRALLHKDVVFRGLDSLLFLPEPQVGIDKDIASAKRFKSGFSQTPLPSQLVLATPNKVAIIFQMKAKANADNPIEALRGKSVSMFGAQLFTLDDSGKILSGDSIIDDETMLHQIGILPNKDGSADSLEMWADPMVALATGSDVEKANLEASKKLGEARVTGDADAIATLMSEPFTVNDVADPKPTVFKTRAEFKKMHDELTKQVDLVSRRVDESFAAGDWTFERFQQVAQLKVDTTGLKGSKGKSLKRTAFAFTRFRDGLATEMHFFVNDLQLGVQLGAIDLKEITAKLAPTKPDDAK